METKFEGRLRLSKLVGTTMAAVDGGEAQHVTTVEMPLEIKADRELLGREPWRHMFPFALEAMSAIAGREDEDKRGLDMTARGDVSDLHVELWDMGPVEGAAFAFPLSKVKGRPKLRIDEQGDAWVDFKIRAQLTSPQLGKLGPYTNADVMAVLLTSQRTLDEHREAVAAKPKKSARPKSDYDDMGKPAGPWDGEQGHMTIIWNEDARAHIAEAARLDLTVLDEAGLRASCQKVARLRLGMKAKRITISLADAQDVTENNAKDLAAALDAKDKSAAE